MRNALFVLTGALLLCGCPSSRKISNQNIAHLYRKGPTLLTPVFTVYHESDSISRLYFKIDSEQLLYTRHGIDKEFEAGIRLSYRLTSSYESIEIIDSASTSVTDVNSENVKKEIIGSMKLKVAQGGSYLLHVRLVDARRGHEASAYITIDKTSINTRQNFLALSPSTGLPIFRNHITASEQVQLITRSKTSKLLVRYYKRDFPVAAPPYSIVVNKSFQYKADSTFTITLDGDSSALVNLPREGLYHFQHDTSRREGFTLFRFRGPYPEIGSPVQLVQPLLYITTAEEFDNLSKQEDAKAAADDFWLKMSGSKERAKELIRKYYSRVQEANTYFTSYLEGWKTDRGMIYIVYGPPAVVFRSNTAETWIYGQDKLMSQSSFTFARTVNPFTDNDYSMERSTVYKSGFQNAVTVWRQGRVYIEN
jgi:GWxTD domain-containing protein